jgi:hypothetical protein
MTAKTIKQVVIEEIEKGIFLSGGQCFDHYF